MDIKGFDSSFLNGDDSKPTPDKSRGKITIRGMGPLGAMLSATIGDFDSFLGQTEEDDGMLSVSINGDSKTEEELKADLQRSVHEMPTKDVKELYKIVVSELRSRGLL